MTPVVSRCPHGDRPQNTTPLRCNKPALTVDTGLWAATQCVVLAWQQANLNLKVQARDGARRSTWHVGSRIDPPPVC